MTSQENFGGCPFPLSQHQNMFNFVEIYLRTPTKMSFTLHYISVRAALSIASFDTQRGRVVVQLCLWRSYLTNLSFCLSLGFTLSFLDKMLCLFQYICLISLIHCIIFHYYFSHIHQNYVFKVCDRLYVNSGVHFKNNSNLNHIQLGGIIN